jgi:hypothetical protein
MKLASHMTFDINKMTDIEIQFYCKKVKRSLVSNGKSNHPRWRNLPAPPTYDDVETYARDVYHGRCSKALEIEVEYSPSLPK